MGCGASKVANQTISPVQSEIPSNVETITKAKSSITSSSPSPISPLPPPQTKPENEIITPKKEKLETEQSQNPTPKPENIDVSPEIDVSKDTKTEVPSPPKLEKSNSKTSLHDNADRVSVSSKKSEKSKRRVGSSKSSSSSATEKKDMDELLNNKYGNEKVGLSQSSSEATLTNQNSSDNLGGKLSLNSSFVPLPAIAPKTNLKPISFEIPLDESMICKTIRPSFKGSLPKLQISQDELKKKIGNVDSKWKDMYVMKNGYRRKTQIDDEKLQALKLRLLEKESEAAMNRQRELDKLKAKLEKAQKHALKVQERKRKLEAEWISKSKSNLEMSSKVNYIS